MSWGRIDDGYWDHPKTKALIEIGDDGLRAAGAYWVMMSYCLRNRRRVFSVREAAGLLRRTPDEAHVILAPLLIAPAGFKNGFLLRVCFASTPHENGQAEVAANLSEYTINSFDEFRSKSEAKSVAGSQGGKKSGESRRSKSKQNPKQAEAKHEADAEADTRFASQHRRSKVEPPDPDPSLSLRSRDPDPDPSPREMDSASPRGTITKLHELEQRGYSQFGSLSGPPAAKLREALPISDQEFSDAASAGGRAWGYFAKVLATLREQQATAPIPAMRLENSQHRRDPNRVPREQRDHWKSLTSGMGPILRPDEDLLRDLGPTDEEIRRYHPSIVDAAIASNGPARWPALVDLIRAERNKPTLRIVEGAAQ